jgi:hypothetical protein
MKYAAVGSLIALSTSVAVLMIVDDQNDEDLIRAVAVENDRDTAAAARLVRAQCEQSAESREIVTLAFKALGSYARPEVRDPFLAWVARCIPERDCDVSVVLIPIPDDCATTGPIGPIPDG